MVTTHFLVMVLLSLLCFSVGRLAGRMEASLIMTQRLNEIIQALKKIQTVSALKGENLANLSTEDLVNRIQRQMEIEHDQD